MRPLRAKRPARRLRRDPAPSRLSYRLHRLWLTPLIRRMLRIGLPILLVGVSAGYYLSDETRREAIQAWLVEQRQAFEARPEFMVKLMAIDGASTELATDIREVVPLDFPLSSFDMDLEAIQKTVSALDAVASATVRIRSGGVLQVSVVERIPAVVWRGREDIELLDETGHRVASVIARAIRPDLPLITGDGAETAVPEALNILAAAKPINNRIRGLVRMGERRWDLVLDRNQRILLPEENPVAALERVLTLDKTQDMLSRDLVVVDMRNQMRPTLRLAKTAMQDLREIRTREERIDNQ